MNSVVKGFDSLPRIVKVIFALPILDILYGRSTDFAAV